MFGFVRNNHYERVLAERERVIQLLAEQVEFLRGVLNRSNGAVAMLATTPILDMADIPDEMKMTATNALSDDEEQLEAMHQAHVINDLEYAQALERIKSREPGDIIE